MNWSKAKAAVFQDKLLQWYELNKRPLPWREDTEPYHIWISEIMAQQTQVETVIPYYERFMAKYPSIADLAAADDAELLKLWEGLGYYSRARNLKIAAQQVMTDFAGVFPQELSEIKELKGIGAYTAAAIASISFNLPEPAIDGNLFRVTSRLFELENDISQAQSRKVFDEYLRDIISHDQPGNFNQAFMDLGARICKPKEPICEECLISEFCSAYAHNTQENFPVKSKKLKQVPVYYQAFVLQDASGRYLLTQRPSEGLLASMWTFPLVEVAKEAKVQLPDNLKARVVKVEEIGQVKHIFSHQKWYIQVFNCMLEAGVINEQQEVYNQARYDWVAEQDLANYALAGPQLKMFKLLKK